jgi:hypothetical protein
LILVSLSVLLGILLLFTGLPGPLAPGALLPLEQGVMLGQPAAASELYPTLPREDFVPRPPIVIRPPYWDTMQVGLEILVDGRPLRTVQHAGRTYLPVSRYGVEYEIRVWNHGPRRIAAIVSVDGLSVLNGQPASESQPGYLVDARGSVLIKGWRQSMDRVAAFSFEERANSYASRVGRPENIGVIGLIAIEEMIPWAVPRLEEKDSPARSAKELHGEVGGTGTGYGREIDSRIYYVPFVRSANKRTVTIYYDTVDALRRAGVPVDGFYPVPFPGDPSFVPPPPGFKGG